MYVCMCVRRYACCELQRVDGFQKQGTPSGGSVHTDCTSFSTVLSVPYAFALGRDACPSALLVLRLAHTHVVQATDKNVNKCRIFCAI